MVKTGGFPFEYKGCDIKLNQVCYLDSSLNNQIQRPSKMDIIWILASQALVALATSLHGSTGITSQAGGKSHDFCWLYGFNFW